MKRTKGFTLIELLVIISIIGLLSSVTLASLDTARTKARDVERRAKAVSIRTALISYSLDHNGTFPKCGNFENSGGSGFEGFVTRSYDSNWNGCLAPALEPYIDPLPIDSINGMHDGKPIYFWYDCLAPSPSSITCGDDGFRFNIYFETGGILGWHIN